MKGVAFANTPGQLSQKSYNAHAHYGESVKAYIAKHSRLPKFKFNNNYKNQKKNRKKTSSWLLQIRQAVSVMVKGYQIKGMMKSSRSVVDSLSLVMEITSLSVVI